MHRVRAVPVPSSSPESWKLVHVNKRRPRQPRASEKGKGSTMIKPLLTISTAACAAMAAFFATTTSAELYPVAPPGSFVTLTRSSFIQSVPYTSWTGMPDPSNPAIGDNLYQHPGGFYTGQPLLGTYFIGVFAEQINASVSGAAIYLWETSGPIGGGGQGPQVQLGRWTGTTFQAYGSPQPASYLDTGVWLDTGGGLYMELYSSLIPLSAFGIEPGFPFLLNAVRIEAADLNAHNQLIAAAVVPEPSATFILAAGLACLLGGRRFPELPRRLG
jgi:hypothetical protein